MAGKTREPISTKRSQQAEVTGLGSLGFWKEGPAMALQPEHMGKGRPSPSAGPAGREQAREQAGLRVGTRAPSRMKTLFATLTTFGLSDP